MNKDFGTIEYLLYYIVCDKYGQVLDEDKLREELKEKNQFAISVAEYLGKYITHILKYYYANLHSETVHAEYLYTRQNLLNIEKEIEQVNRKINSVDSSSDDFLKLELKKESLSDKKQKFQREYEEKRYEDHRNSEQGNRTIANECFFTLKTMLYGIKEAGVLRQKLDIIHNGSARSDWNVFEQNWLSNSIDELMYIYDEFKSDYLTTKQRIFGLSKITVSFIQVLAHFLWKA